MEASYAVVPGMEDSGGWHWGPERHRKGERSRLCDMSSLPLCCAEALCRLTRACMDVKVVVFGGGSFGTAMACALARQKGQLNVTLLLRDPYVCKDINERHVNPRYLKVRYHLL